MIRVVHYTQFDPHVVEVSGDDYSCDASQNLVITKDGEEVARFLNWSYVMKMEDVNA